MCTNTYLTFKTGGIPNVPVLGCGRGHFRRQTSQVQWLLYLQILIATFVDHCAHHAIVHLHGKVLLN